MQQFVTIDRVKIDLIEHCFQQRVKHPNLTVHIGCDSVVVGGKIWYVTVVAFRYDKNGAHFIFTKVCVPSYRKHDNKPDIFTRLFQEAVYSLEVADFLVENNIFIKENLVLEFDYNDMKTTKSTPLIGAAAGMATAKGYNFLLKFDDQIACKAADKICDKC